MNIYMLQKGCYSTKTFLTIISQKFITLYTVVLYALSHFFLDFDS